MPQAGQKRSTQIPVAGPWGPLPPATRRTPCQAGEVEPGISLFLRPTHCPSPRQTGLPRASLHLLPDTLFLDQGTWIDSVKTGLQLATHQPCQGSVSPGVRKGIGRQLLPCPALRCFGARVLNPYFAHAQAPAGSRVWQWSWGTDRKRRLVHQVGGLVVRGRAMHELRS